MFLKKIVQDYFTFTKRDRIGVLAILVLIAIIYLFPYLFSKKQEPFEKALVIKAADSLSGKQATGNNVENSEEDIASTHQYQKTETASFIEGDLFQFDPNTLSTEGWKKLGLNERTIKTINNYRSKGGRFYKPEDLRKIWGLPNGFYERVKDYISIFNEQNKQTAFSKPAYEKPERKIGIVNINEADTAAFIALPGIGSKLAARIINFRDKLGGFYSVDQIGETYGLPDSTFQKIKLYLKSDGEIKKINVNTATKDVLKTHPYIRWNLANVIVEYRNQHGSFKSLDDLKNIGVMDETSFNKIIHYLSL